MTLSLLNQFALVPVFLITLTSLSLLLARNWRWLIFALAVQYICVFWLTALSWQIGLSAVKLIAGWMAGAVLTASQPNRGDLADISSGYSPMLFRLLSAGLIWVLVINAAPTLAIWLPVQNEILIGGWLLIGMGLLQLGVSQSPVRITFGLLNVLSGFEVMYAAQETSILVAGLLVGITLALALIGAYLINLPPTVEEEA